MSELKKIREQQHLTQEELAEQSGISVRTIQRIEAGTEPKAYTLKTLAKTLNISEKELLNPTEEEVSTPEFPIITEPITDQTNYTLVKIINLSSLPVSWFPIANFLPPLLLMLFTKQKSNLVKQIISLQMIIAVIAPILFMLIVFLKLGKSSVIITIILLTLVNIYIILRNTFEIDKRKQLRYKLTFNLL